MGTDDGNESSLIRRPGGVQDSNRAASLAKVAFDAIVTFDLQERVISWNPAAELMYGWTAQEALGKTPGELFWSQGSPQEMEQKKQRQLRLSQGETLLGEASACRKDGSQLPVQYAVCAIFDADGSIREYLAVFRDRSVQVQASKNEEQLKKSNQRLNEILSSILDDFYVLDRDWFFVFASRTFTSRIGKEPEDFVGNNIWEMFPKHVGGVLYENFQTAMERREIRRFAIPGKYTDAWYRMTVFPSADGITVLGTDITENKRAERALRESERQLQLLNESLEQKVQEKTEEVRRLASDTTKAVQRERHRISHILHDDLQQRIYALQMQLTFLRYELGTENEPARNELSDVERQLGEILQITRHLSIDLSPPILKDEGLAHAINWLAGQMLQRYGLPIEVQADGPVAIPDEELHVLLFNCVRELLFNAVKHSRASRASVALQRSDDGLRIEVSDNGIGFPLEMPGTPSLQETSADEPLQTGFGLPTIRKQLSLFGGHMGIKSEPESGTRIVLFVPISSEEG